VFVVDRDGIVRDRFEGAVSVDELVRSIRRNLLS
jgi:glutathione peroxidase-family protein